MEKTIGDLINEARVKSGAKQYSGHDIMDLMRFDVNTKHMIVFDVLSDDGTFGMKGERSRLFLSEEGYQKAMNQMEEGKIKVLNHAKVSEGHLKYDHKEHSL